jgi:heptosyltransferase-2
MELFLGFVQFDAKAVDNKLKSINNIIVRCPNWVGDIVMATPVFECLRSNFPDARIHAFIRTYARGIIEDSSWFDSINDCNDKKFHGFMGVINEIKTLKPDMAILLPNSIRSFLTAKLGGVKLIYGYRRNLRTFFMSGGPKPARRDHGIKPVPMVDYYMEICRYLGLKISENPKPSLYISGILQKKGESILQQYGISEKDRLIGLNPGASFGSSKCWPPENFAKLAELIEKEMFSRIILLVGPGEEEIAKAIVYKSRAKIIDTSRNILDLAELKPIIKRCSLLVTNDTGPRHYAVAFDVPVVVLMGPTNPVYTAANLDRTIVVREEMDCSPCHKKICPTDHRCMRDITPEKVFENVKKLLKGFDKSQ